MKKQYIIIGLATLLLGGTLVSCDDFLDREPTSKLSSDSYFTDASQLQSYVDNLYTSILPGNSGNSYGFYAQDQGTDNQIAQNVSSKFCEGEWKVPNNGGSWSFTNIYHLNFFFANVLPKFGDDLSGSKNTISGNLQSIRHFIGEMYFLRALEYYKRYKEFGDYPIITEPLSDNMEILTEAAKRSPRNEVARFILSDLNKAIDLMSGTDMQTTRINKDAALLIKSRVALYEGIWLKYFKGTAFVPNGEGWPGKTKEYNADYQYPSGSIDSEINWFLEQSMAASKEVAEKYKGSLTVNSGVLKQNMETPENPYFAMFSQEDLSKVKEVLLWRQYVQGLGSNHDVALAADEGNWGVGVTRGYVQNFLMADGTPVYTHGTYADGDGYYMGDKTIADVRKNRDSRLSLFLKEPGQKNVLVESVKGLTNIWFDEPYPKITEGGSQYAYTTGYALRKGGAWDSKYLVQNKCFLGLAIYRSAEALLNYMEASYERNHTLDASATEYWKILRRRALVSDNLEKTIDATDMSKETLDWGAYSAGKLLDDPVLFNIRRERRDELMGEALRWMDLQRWRALDQMMTTRYHVEGMKLWNSEMTAHYDFKEADYNGDAKAKVSAPGLSDYLRIYEKNMTANNLYRDGYTWHLAHYLQPMPIKEMMLTAPDYTTVSESSFYQNPYWPTETDKPAEK